MPNVAKEGIAIMVRIAVMQLTGVVIVILAYVSGLSILLPAVPVLSLVVVEHNRVTMSAMREGYWIMDGR